MKRFPDQMHTRLAVVSFEHSPLLLQRKCILLMQIDPRGSPNIIEHSPLVFQGRTTQWNRHQVDHSIKEQSPFREAELMALDTQKSIMTTCSLTL